MKDFIQFVLFIGVVLFLGKGCVACKQSINHDYMYGPTRYHVVCPNREFSCRNLRPLGVGGIFHGENWTVAECYPGDGTVKRFHTDGCSW